MQIAGGCYRELCCLPEWNELYGSGGRAAAAISASSPGSVLHTYIEDTSNLEYLKSLGIKTQAYSRSSAIVFSYFHTLSNPYIQPPLDEIAKQSKINVSGDVVLRFGFLEGEAVIDARRAVFDPQSLRDFTAFWDNGSNAKELAIVLNELELQCATEIDDIRLAALYLIEFQAAKVVVVKGGVKGATVFESNGRITTIPSYRSTKVFKIGTGDVFSAVFTHHWGEKGVSAADAADIASRSVAEYCSTNCLPVIEGRLSQLEPISYSSGGSILLLGKTNSVGRRYVMEEARFVLRDLGISVSCPLLGDSVSGKESALLIIADGLGSEVIDLLVQAKDAKKRVVILNETKEKIDDRKIGGFEVIDDFSTAIYHAAWASAENN